MSYLSLSGVRKFSVSLQHLICVLASILGIIPIRRNKQNCHTTPQTESMIPNVSWRWFLSFDTPTKGKSGLDHFETFKTCRFSWICSFLMPDIGKSNCLIKKIKKKMRLDNVLNYSDLERFVIKSISRFCRAEKLKNVQLVPAQAAMANLTVLTVLVLFSDEF